MAIKDFFVDERNCSQSDEVLTGIEIPFTDEVTECLTLASCLNYARKLAY